MSAIGSGQPVLGLPKRTEKYVQVNTGEEESPNNKLELLFASLFQHLGLDFYKFDLSNNNLNQINEKHWKAAENRVKLLLKHDDPALRKHLLGKLNEAFIDCMTRINDEKHTKTKRDALKVSLTQYKLSLESLIKEPSQKKPEAKEKVAKSNQKEEKPDGDNLDFRDLVIEI